MNLVQTIARHVLEIVVVYVLADIGHRRFSVQTTTALRGVDTHLSHTKYFFLICANEAAPTGFGSARLHMNPIDPREGEP